MTIQVFNTLHGKKEEFVPIEDGKIQMYVCGPTVYDSCHIGHARSVVVFDAVARYFKMRGFDVTYVRNFTDVDDKIINRANKLGTTSDQVAEKYIAEFYRDMDALYVQRATYEPRVTEYISEIIAYVTNLIEKGMAYPVDGDVYYAVEKFDGYGKLSHRKLDEMNAGARVDVDERKQNPFDFALWKSAKPDEPAWDSPWGKGRPGWHIECSAMSSSLLGNHFDIHGGGKDLIFPHHENEIAQSEGLNNGVFANYWMHNGFVNIDQEKMSKSLGNFTTIREVLDVYHPEAVRLFLLSNHYRSPIDFSAQNMKEAESGIEKLYALLARIDEIAPSTDAVPPGAVMARFQEAMDDDFNTARGIGVLFETVRSTNRRLDSTEDPATDLLEELKTIRSDFIAIGQVLGIFNQPAVDFFAERQQQALAAGGLAAAEIEALLEERSAARKDKNWARADEIRDQLLDQNIQIKDHPDGSTTWTVGG